MKDSETQYESTKSDFSNALDATHDQLQLVSQHLQQFGADCEGIGNENSLKQDALNVAATINSTYIIAYKALEESRQVCTTHIFLMPST